MESNKQAEMGDSMTAEFITLRDGNDLGRQLPPPGMQANITLASETPGSNAGSFSYANMSQTRDNEPGKR